jgi:hypothetical protein
MYLTRQSFYLKVGIDVMKGMMRSLEVSKVATNSSQNVCLG